MHHAATSGRPRLTGFVLGALATALAIGPPAPAWAYRPFDGTDAQVAPLRALETEFGPLAYLRSGDERLLAVPQLTLNYGAGSGFEFVLDGRRTMTMSPSPDGQDPRIDEASFNVKKVLRNGVLQGAKGPSIATEESLLLPTTDAHGTGASASLIASQRWKRMALHLNGALARTREHSFGRFASVIVEGPDRWHVRPVTELSVEREGEEPIERALLVGVLWETRDGIIMDGGIRTARADEHALELRAGITFKHHVHGPRI